VPEAATEQLPKISGPPPGRNSTGQHPVPFPPTRTGFAPVPASFGPDQRNGIATPQQERFPDDYANTGLEGLDDLDEDRPLEDYPGYPDSDDEPDAYPDSYPDEDVDDEDAPSPGREWLIMAGQVAVSVVGGAAVWLGFNWLWGRFPQAALVAALAVIVGLVWIVRKIRRADDLQTTGLAVLVGLFVTVSPAALLLLSR
jgi:hypothetical protein